MKSIQDRWLSGRTLSDQDVASIAAAVGSMMENPSGRFPTSLGEEAKRRSDQDRANKRAGRTVSDQDKVFGFKKGGPAKKRAKGGRAKK